MCVLLSGVDKMPDKRSFNHHLHSDEVDPCDFASMKCSFAKLFAQVVVLSFIFVVKRIDIEFNKNRWIREYI